MQGRFIRAGCTETAELLGVRAQPAQPSARIGAACTGNRQRNRQQSPPEGIPRRALSFQACTRLAPVCIAVIDAGRRAWGRQAPHALVHWTARARFAARRRDSHFLNRNGRCRGPQKNRNGRLGGDKPPTRLPNRASVVLWSIYRLACALLLLSDGSQIRTARTRPTPGTSRTPAARRSARTRLAHGSTARVAPLCGRARNVPRSVAVSPPTCRAVRTPRTASDSCSEVAMFSRRTTSRSLPVVRRWIS